jgi:hypothetical protein
MCAPPVYQDRPIGTAILASRSLSRAFGNIDAISNRYWSVLFRQRPIVQKSASGGSNAIILAREEHYRGDYGTSIVARQLTSILIEIFSTVKEAKRFISVFYF